MGGGVKLGTSAWVEARVRVSERKLIDREAAGACHGGARVDTISGPRTSGAPQ